MLTYFSVFKGWMCESVVRVSEIAVFVVFIGKVVSVCSSEVRTVIRELEPLMQLLFMQKKNDIK